MWFLKKYLIRVDLELAVACVEWVKSLRNVSLEYVSIIVESGLC